MPSDSELQDLTADIEPAAGDVVYVVIDPAGTPLARKMTVENLKGRASVVRVDHFHYRYRQVADWEQPRGHLGKVHHPGKPIQVHHCGNGGYCPNHR